MAVHCAARVAATPDSAAPVVSTATLIQRRCACGSHAGLSGRCASCESEERFGPTGVQEKLVLGAPDDAYEQEADRLAEEVVGVPDSDAPLVLHRKITPLVQRQTTPGETFRDEEEEDQTLQAQEAEEATRSEEEDEEGLQARRESHRSPGAAPGIDFRAELAAERCSGMPMDAKARAYMESRFGVDFSHVRIHAGARADRLARHVHAQAFTLGEHVYFGSGRYEPTSAAGRQLLAHELVHTLQQAGGGPPVREPAAAALSAGAAEAEAVPKPAGHGEGTIQRAAKEDTFVPAVVPDGEVVHAILLPEIGKQNPELYSEVKIPGAKSTGLAETAGIADFYKVTSGTQTTIAVLMVNDEPRFLESRFKSLASKQKGLSSHLLKGDQQFPHKEKGAPRGLARGEAACDGRAGVQVCRLDQVPETIRLGDLKPPAVVKSGRALEGTIQIESYREGIKSTASALNEFVRNNPTRAHPATPWNPGTDILDKADIKIPPRLRIGSTGGRLEGLRLYDDRPKDDPIPGLKGRLAVYKSDEPGVWTYEWIPTDIPRGVARDARSPRLTRALARIDTLIRQLKSPTKRTRGAKKAASGPPPRAVIQRRTEFDPKTWPAEFRKWQQEDAKAILGSEAVGRAGVGVPVRESKEARAVRIAAGLADIKQRLPSSELPRLYRKLPSVAATTVAGLRRMRLWARWGSLFGRLRTAFGTVFVKIAALYDKAKRKFDSMRANRSAEEPKSGGAIAKAIFVGAFRVATAFFKVMVQRISNQLKRSLKSGAKVLMEELFGEEKLAKLSEAKEALETMVSDIETKVKAEVTEHVEALTKPYEEIFAKIEKINEWAGDITKFSSAVRWGLRIVQCVTPPGVGCLKLILQAAAERLAAEVVQSCWFVLNFIKPLIRRVEVFKTLPDDISGFILEHVKKIAGVLPVSAEALDKAFAKPKVSTDVGGRDLECDPTKITKAQREMNKLLDDYGPARVRDIIRILEAAGVTDDAEMTLADVEILRGLLQKIDAGEITPDQIERAAENLEAGNASGNKDVDATLRQLSVVPAGTGGGAGAGGAVTRQTYQQAKTSVPPAGGTVEGTFVQVIGSSLSHKAGGKATITLAGFVHGSQVSEITGVPATVVEVREEIIDDVKHRRPVYRIPETVLFTHTVEGVGYFVLEANRDIPGRAFPVEEAQPALEGAE